MEFITDGTSPFTYQYLPNSKLIEKVIGLVHAVTNTYDLTRDVLISKQNKVGSAVVSPYDYSVNGAPSLNPVYDDDGNATSYRLPVSPGANSPLTWDAENRMISATVGAGTTRQQFDAVGRRISKTTGTTSTLYVYDGWNCIAATPFLPLSEPHFSPSCAPTRKSNFLAVTRILIPPALSTSDSRRSRKVSYRRY